MSALECVDLHDSATGSLASPNDRPDRQSVLPPLSGKLIVDEKLQLSHSNFKQTICDFFKEKSITPLSQLKATPLFPTPYVLAQFASKTYTDYKTGETDAQYGARLALPEGWKLLTVASNVSKANGYFGSAYWHPEHQQVVIAHRGTKLTKLGALWTDVAGVVFKNHVPQMRSACTFTHEVTDVLREVTRKKGASFQLFFTGHSLGGWLAQITTFTTKYLKIEGNNFLRNNSEQDYHPHTLVFDSPGCKDMLSQMRDTFDVRLDGRSIDLGHLDITSYLSAPNRINTCNAHLGTVCRIFPDLSDMSWWEEHTALYDSATHGLDKIVKAFDPETGQVHKDEQGQLKMQVVVDWPVSAGLSRGKEYTSFFKKHFNNYNPEITDKTFTLKGYHPLRYQTKKYDERVSRLNVFSEEECQFLELYRQIRQLPELFNPKELFSEMEDNQAQEQAVNILKRFEIENDKIRCTDGSALQALIAYVKRLLQLYPGMKENTKRVLSSDEVRNRVYQIETRRYVERIRQSPLQFMSEVSRFREFLESDHRVLHLQMVNGDEWTGLVRVFQVLQKTNCLIEGHYTLLKLEHLLTLNMLMVFRALMHSVQTPYLIMVACESNQLLKAETKDMIRTFFETMIQKPYIKMILTTRSEDTAVHFLQNIGREIFGSSFVTRYEQLTWLDLTSSSQEKLLEKSVKFQGTKIPLNKLISTESAVAKFLPLDALLEEKVVNIADPVPTPNSYDEMYYIGRTVRHQKAMKQDIFNDKDVKYSHVYLAACEQEYEALCQSNPKSNVHWLQKDKSEKLVWQQSQGSLEILRRYIDTESSHMYTPDNLGKLLEQAQNQRVMLISDTAGMGKSTVLTHLSKQVKQKFPAKWVVRIDLNDHTDVLKALKQQKIDNEKAIEFVSEKLLKLKPGLEVELFKQSCEQKQKLRTIIMLDGFDEISPFYKDTVIDLLQALRQTAVEQLWVTTRPHLRNELEDKLQQLSYTIDPFSEENQVDFLTTFWSLKHWFTEGCNKVEEEGKKKLAVFAEKLIKKLAQSVSDSDFTGIPLQCRMLAEAFDEEVKAFCQSDDPELVFHFKIELFDLYKRFIDRKYDIYQREKIQISVNNISAKEQWEWILKPMIEDYQLLALRELFTEKQVALFESKSDYAFPVEQLSRTGIVEVTCDGKPHFIHRTFADYYVAIFFFNKLTKGKSTSQQVQTFILKEIFLKGGYRLIRAFLDGLLSTYKPPVEILKQYGNRTHLLWKEGSLQLHQTLGENNANIVGFLLDSLQAAEHTDTVTELLLAQDDQRLTALYLAALRGNIQVLEQLWEWAKETLRTQLIRNNLLLGTDRKGRTVWHVTAESGNLDVLNEVWDMARETLTTEEINNKLLLARDNTGRTVWHVAVEEGNLEALLEVWEWAKRTLTREEINYKLLLATDDKGMTVWHVAAESGYLEALDIVWDMAKERLTTEEINNKLLLATDHMGRTALHLAVEGGNLEALLKVWECAKETLTREEINYKLLLATDVKERTVWHVATKSGYLEALNKVWDWAKESLTTEEINKKLLLATDDTGRTAWHLVLEGGNLEALLKVWEWAKETLTREEINYKLLLATDDKGRTIWHVAAESGYLEALNKVWDWAKENLTTEEINKKLLLATDDTGRTAWHLVLERGNLEALLKVWEWAKETLTREEINYKLLLATDDKGRTIWHVAAESGYLESLNRVWDMAKETLTTEEINKLLLATDNMGRTAWHLAVESGNLEALLKVWEWAKETVTREEINNKFLLASDSKGRTVWHAAAEEGKPEILQKVWDLAKEKLTTEEINNKLLLATDYYRRTVWHVAAEGGKPEILQKLWELAKEKLTTEQINNKLLLATDGEGRTVWHVAAQEGKPEILQKVWEWAKEDLTTEELNNKLLLAKDYFGWTVWHVAASRGESEILQKVWEWAKETLTTEEINNKLLLATDCEGRTVCHVAVEKSQPKILQKVWELAKEKLTTEEINSKLLLATDSKGRTVWHVAVEGDNLETLQIVREWAK